MLAFRSRITPNGRDRATEIEHALILYDSSVRQLHGLRTPSSIIALRSQIVESLRRIEYIRAIARRPISIQRLNHNGDQFDPLKGAILKQLDGDLDEAMWLVFLATHFGKNSTNGWLPVRLVYGALNQGNCWTWNRVRNQIDEFRNWLNDNLSELRSRGARFSNHRKYESLRGWTHNGTGAAVQSYIEWVLTFGSHRELLDAAIDQGQQDGRRAFGILYESMNAVRRFGRLGKFDFLTMVSKLGFAGIEPDSAYIMEASGPKRGARLLITGDPSNSTLDSQLDDIVVDLGNHLEVNLQVMEDSLCNWQKSPDAFVGFRG